LLTYGSMSAKHAWRPGLRIPQSRLKIIEVNEVWSFCYAKQKNVPTKSEADALWRDDADLAQLIKQYRSTGTGTPEVHAPD
jgi:hypothetical protein